MKNKSAMKLLGTTNIFKTLYLFIKWVLNPQSAVDLGKNIFSNRNNDIHTKIIAVGYLNEFFSKYLEFGKSNQEIVLINQRIDQKIKTGNKVIDALSELRDLRQNLKIKNKNNVDQIVITRKSFGISQGTAKGTVLNIKKTSQKIPNNCIGIFPTSGVKFTNQFLKCAGIVFLNGSVTSHGAILAREFKIPAIVNPNLKIADGNCLLINGSSGEAKVVDIDS